MCLKLQHFAFMEIFKVNINNREQVLAEWLDWDSHENKEHIYFYKARSSSPLCSTRNVRQVNATERKKSHQSAQSRSSHTGSLTHEWQIICLIFKIKHPVQKVFYLTTSALWPLASDQKSGWEEHIIVYFATTTRARNCTTLFQSTSYSLTTLTIVFLQNNQDELVFNQTTATNLSFMSVTVHCIDVGTTDTIKSLQRHNALLLQWAGEI